MACFHKKRQLFKELEFFMENNIPYWVYHTTLWLVHAVIYDEEGEEYDTDAMTEAFEVV
jgi:hypothetical protein